MDLESELKELDSICKLATRTFKVLEKEMILNGGKILLHRAGKKKYSEGGFDIFPRDLFLTSFMLDDIALLKNTLTFSILTQGKENNPVTGEEPGKIIHEYPSITLRERSTKYNASDTTSLFLSGMWKFYQNTGDKSFVLESKNAVASAVEYILKHLNEEGIFLEDPKFCGAEKFALKVTYWKDSGIPKRENFEPIYPVSYTLLQAQVSYSLFSAANLTEEFGLDFDSRILRSLAEKSAKSIFNYFWDDKVKFPVIAVDSNGKISAISSDGLHLLYYLEPEYVPKDKLEDIVKNSELLETPFGYRTYSPKEPEYDPNSYHLGSIWPFEQYFIAEAGYKHSVERFVEVSLRTLQALKMFRSFPEVISFDGKKVAPIWMGIQLWTVAYPLGIRSLLKKILEK